MNLNTPRMTMNYTARSGPAAVVLSPCAACKTLRRRCSERCVLSPYFPPTEPLKFAIAHRVFGAANIVKLLQEVGEDERDDAVSSMVYEANARLRDPVYGCAGSISQLQQQIMELEAEVARTHAQIFNMQCQNTNLLHQLCTSQHEDVPILMETPFGHDHDHDQLEREWYYRL